MLILGFPDYDQQAQAIAGGLHTEYSVIDIHHFPDGESRLRLPPRVSEHVVLCRSLDRANDKLIELLLAAESARASGASRLTLIAPYLCYMRQDRAFQPGEVVSQQIIGRFLAGLFDTVITVDPHLHRVHSLQQAVPAQRSVALSAAPAMGEFLAARPGRPLLIGPDEESEQWVRIVARQAELDYVVARKARFGDRSVEIRLPAANYAGVDVVLVDDVVSTGHTLAEAARALKESGARRIDVLVTHAVFSDGALDMLEAVGVGEVWSSDSVPHPSNAFTLSLLLAGAVTKQQ